MRGGGATEPAGRKRRLLASPRSSIHHPREPAAGGFGPTPPFPPPIPKRACSNLLAHRRCCSDPGLATAFVPGPRRRSGGSSRVFDEAAARPHLLKRKSSGEVDAAPVRRVRRSPPASSRKELPVALHLPKVEAEVLLPQPKAGSSAGDDGNNVDESSDEASLAELGVKVFPNMPPQSAANTWVRFVNNAKACINHYNKKYQVASWVRLLVEAGLKKSPHLPTRQSTRKKIPSSLGSRTAATTTISISMPKTRKVTPSSSLVRSGCALCLRRRMPLAVALFHLLMLAGNVSKPSRRR
ncbi:uncharacterized protein LOC112884363 [Panicum hallii]|uniref:uncharacterized protein LOC112884363 n=1 Tax=Panicum hallii TaxID=206008 RepID=UPI000DF4E6F0|nr:uncharacterized protein LOC112884363 [Panicum hallii]